MSIILIEFISLFVNFAILFLLFFFLIKDKIRRTKILKVVFFLIVIILHIYSIVVRIKPANSEIIFTTYCNKTEIKFLSGLGPESAKNHTSPWGNGSPDPPRDLSGVGGGKEKVKRVPKHRWDKVVPKD